jgi:serine/threonine-protein kinase Stk1
MNVALHNDLSLSPVSRGISTEYPFLQMRYALRNIAGVGGMGVVYRANDTLLSALGASDDIVAVKMCSSDMTDQPQAEQRLLMEYRNATRLKHPNIIAMRQFDVCRQQQKAFLVMEWLDGLSLEQLLYQQQLPADVALKLARQLVDAVSYCHSRGVVHADIKPANFQISPENHLTLFDFGISRWLYQPSTIRNDMIRACSCRYAAPELFNEQPSTISSDLFSVCCVLYRLFRGEHPFNDSTDEAAARNDAIIPIFGRRHPLDKVLQQGLKWQPQDRNTSLDALQQVLSQLSAADLSRHWF